MTTRFSFPLYPGLAFLLLAIGCSGGVNITANPPTIPSPLPEPTSEAIISRGVIDGPSGVTVNDVRYSANAALVTVNGLPGTLSDLKPGQVVTVRGRINSLGQTGTADRIDFDANLIGPVEDLDPAEERMIVMGQSVITDADTRFGVGIDPASFGGLATGSIIQVSGFRDAGGAIRATRIEIANARADLQVIGKVTGLDSANLLFAVGRLTVDYSSAILIELPGGAPANGMLVKAVGNVSGGLFVVERLLSASGPAEAAGQRVHAAGMITRFGSASDFDVDGTAASVDAATSYVGGHAGQLVLNARVCVYGSFGRSGRVAARQVTFGRVASTTTRLTYDLRDFTEISVPTVFNLLVRQGPEYSVEVIIDADDAGRVDVTQTGSRLNVALRPGNGRIDTIEARVTMPVLDRMDLSGVVNVSLIGFQQPAMTINVGGVSRVHGSELTIGSLTASVTGVSHLDLGGIRPIGAAHVDVSGVSRATVNMAAGSTLTGSVRTGQGTGTSVLYYYGTNVTNLVTTDSISSVVRLGGTRP